MFSAGVSRFSKLLESESVFKTAGVGVGFLKLSESGVGFSKLQESEHLLQLPTPIFIK